MDANYLIFIHGAQAMRIALLRANGAGRSARNHRHWARVSRLIARMLKRSDRATLQAA